MLQTTVTNGQGCESRCGANPCQQRGRSRACSQAHSRPHRARLLQPLLRHSFRARPVTVRDTLHAQQDCLGVRLLQSSNCAARVCRAEPTGNGIPAPVDGRLPQVAVEGDMVSLHYTCMDENGQKLESSRDSDEPVTFELGAGEVFANPVFKAFDTSVRGLAIGEKAYLRCSGGEWDRELLFEVERTHPEIARLEGRYKNVGGLADGLVVELANGSNAVVLNMDESVVRLDANPMLAGKQLVFELELLSIEPTV